MLASPFHHQESQFLLIQNKKSVSQMYIIIAILLQESLYHTMVVGSSIKILNMHYPHLNFTSLF